MNAVRARAQLLLSQDRFDLAETAWREVLALEPGDAEGHGALALCLCEREAFPEAESEARTAVGLAPDAGYAHFVLARILTARKRYAEALAATAEAVMRDPENADYRAMEAAIHSAQERWKECLAAADAGLALDAEHLGCANLRAAALTHLDRKDEAEATISGALQRAPEDSLTHANQGWAELHRGRHQEAMVHFRESLRLDPTSEWARQGLLTALKARNPLFRGMLAFFLFMSRQGATVRWLIVACIIVGQNVARMAAQAMPQYGMVLWPIVIALVAFVYLTWLANPLMNLAMFLHPMGRHVLDADQRRQAMLVGLVVAVAAINAAAMLCLDGLNWGAMIPVALVIPVSTIHSMNSGWPRLLAAVIASAFALAALEMMVTGLWDSMLNSHGTRIHSPAGSLFPTMVSLLVALVMPYFYGILIWSFLSPQLARVQPTR